MSNPAQSIRRTVFYSWQSDLPNSCNRRLIRSQLRSALNEVEGAHEGLVLEIDEATRDLPGSPHIPTAITDKIRLADYFVCDVSTINGNVSETRRCPNPNVVFELGYAVATLDWGRIVMLFNSEFGELTDLPFDFDRHRASPYRAGEKPTKSEEAALRSLLTTAIDEMVKSNPDKPGREMSPDMKRRARDVAKLTEILSVLHLPTIDQHIEEAPHIVLGRTLNIWEDFNFLIQSSTFHLYDTALLELLRRFHRAFFETVRYDELYHANHTRDLYIFTNPGDLPLADDRKEKWEKMREAAADMHQVLPQILKRIREEYIEIDLDDTNHAAWDRQIELHRRMSAHESQD